MELRVKQKTLLKPSVSTVSQEPNRFLSSPLSEDRIKISQAHVHKTQDSNRLLSWVTSQTDEGGRSIYRAQVRVLPEHPYFFEHDRRHIPGLYIIEAGRQLGLAVPHLFFDVGYDYGFVLDGCDMKFTGFANLQDKLIIEAHTFNAVERKGKLQSISFEGRFYQNGERLVRYTSHIRLIHERLLKRYERQSR